MTTVQRVTVNGSPAIALVGTDDEILLHVQRMLALVLYRTSFEFLCMEDRADCAHTALVVLQHIVERR